MLDKRGVKFLKEAKDGENEHERRNAPNAGVNDCDALPYIIVSLTTSSARISLLRLQLAVWLILVGVLIVSRDCVVGGGKHRIEQAHSAEDVEVMTVRLLWLELWLNLSAVLNPWVAIFAES